MVYPLNRQFNYNLLDGSRPNLDAMESDRARFIATGQEAGPQGLGNGMPQQQQMQQMPMPVFPDMQFQPAPEGMIDFNAQAMQLAGPLPDMSQYFGQPMTSQPQTGGSPTMQPDVGQPGGLLGQPSGIGGGPYIDPRTGMPTGGNEMPVNLPSQGNGQAPPSPQPNIPDPGPQTPYNPGGGNVGDYGFGYNPDRPAIDLQMPGNPNAQPSGASPHFGTQIASGGQQQSRAQMGQTPGNPTGNMPNTIGGAHQSTLGGIAAGASNQAPGPQTSGIPERMGSPSGGLLGLAEQSVNSPTTNAPANQQDMLRQAIALRNGGGSLDPMQALSLMRRLQGNRGMF